MQEKVYEGRIEYVNELHMLILTDWDELEQCVIDAAVRQCRMHLHACVKAKGGHFEHKLRK